MKKNNTRRNRKKKTQSSQTHTNPSSLRRRHTHTQTHTQLDVNGARVIEMYLYVYVFDATSVYRFDCMCLYFRVCCSCTRIELLLFEMCTYFLVAIVLVVGALCRKQHIDRTQKLSNVTHILVHIVASNDSWSNSIEIVCFFSSSSFFHFFLLFYSLSPSHHLSRSQSTLFDEVL